MVSRESCWVRDAYINYSSLLLYSIESCCEVETNQLLSVIKPIDILGLGHDNLPIIIH